MVAIRAANDRIYWQRNRLTPAEPLQHHAHTLTCRHAGEFQIVAGENDDVAVGHLVIAQEGKWDGWWEAIVLARDGDMLTLKWRDYPDHANVRRHAGSVALLKPSPVSA
jgi:hypothetical protein